MATPVTLERQQAAFYARLLRAAYQSAHAAQWDSASRLELLHVTLRAVQGYLGQAPDDPDVLVYHTMLVDLLTQAPPSQFESLDEFQLRAARVAATRVLQNPKTPPHRPKSQNLLKRLDLLQNPLFRARETFLLRVSQRLKGEPEQAKAWGAPLAGTFIILRRVNRVVGLCAVPDADDPRAGSFARALETLGRLLETAELTEPGLQTEIFIAAQGLVGVHPQEPTFKALRGALEHLADEALMPDRVLRHAILYLIFQIDLAALGMAERPAITQWLGRLPAMLKRLAEVDTDEQDAALMRMRHHLAAPTALGLDERLEAAFVTLKLLNVRRDAAIARLARLEQSVDPLIPLDTGTKAELSALRGRLRRVLRLRDVLLGANLHSSSSQAVALLPRLYERLEQLADATDQPEEYFSAALVDLRRQLDAPQAAARPWFPRACEVLKRVEGILNDNPKTPGTTWAGDPRSRGYATLEKARITLQLLTQGGQVAVDDGQMNDWIASCAAGLEHYQAVGDDGELAPVIAQMMAAIPRILTSA